MGKRGKIRRLEKARNRNQLPFRPDFKARNERPSQLNRRADHPRRGGEQEWYDARDRTKRFRYNESRFYALGHPIPPRPQFGYQQPCPPFRHQNVQGYGNDCGGKPHLPRNHPPRVPMVRHNFSLSLTIYNSHIRRSSISTA